MAKPKLTLIALKSWVESLPDEASFSWEEREFRITRSCLVARYVQAQGYPAAEVNLWCINPDYLGTEWWTSTTDLKGLIEKFDRYSHLGEYWMKADVVLLIEMVLARCE